MDEVDGQLRVYLITSDPEKGFWRKEARALNVEESEVKTSGRQIIGLTLSKWHVALLSEEPKDETHAAMRHWATKEAKGSSGGVVDYIVSRSAYFSEPVRDLSARPSPQAVTEFLSEFVNREVVVSSP